MNYFLFILRGAFADFDRNKGRTILTSLGILIGVLSVVLIISFGLGLRKYIQDQFESLAPNLLRVVPGQILANGSFRGGPGGFGGIRFDERDILRLQRIRGVEYVVPLFTKTTRAAAGGEAEIVDLYTSSEAIFAALNLKPAYGELFTEADVDKRNKIAVLGSKIAEELFGSGDLALGSTVKIEGQSFRVRGVLESKGGGGFGGPDFDAGIYVPYKTGFVFNPDKQFLAMIVKGYDNEDVNGMQLRIEDAMEKRYDQDEFSVIKQTDLIEAISSIFNILNTALIAIAAISLIVGGIGIMNIMYVTVTERIREIGIRRAIGARRSDILYQFLVESVILSLFGGVMAIILAFIIIHFVQEVFPAYINVATVLVALGVSTAIGVVFGVFPAKRAADLSPIDAIRYE